MLQSLNPWFANEFNDSNHIDDWAKTNFLLFSKKEVSLAALDTSMLKFNINALCMTSEDKKDTPIQVTANVPEMIQPTVVALEAKEKRRFTHSKDEQQERTSRRTKAKITPVITKHKKRRNEVESEMDDDNSESTVDEDQKIQVLKKTAVLKKPLGVPKHDLEWWKQVTSKHFIKLIEQYPEQQLSNLKISFQTRRILYFRTMYYLKRRLPDGAAVGDLKMCKKVASKKTKSGNSLPPFIIAKTGSSLSNEIQQVKKVFDHLWFHCVFDESEDTSKDNEQLILWADLQKENQKKPAAMHLIEMLRCFFESIADGNTKLASFLQSCVTRGLSA